MYPFSEFILIPHGLGGGQSKEKPVLMMPDRRWVGGY